MAEKKTAKKQAKKVGGETDPDFKHLVRIAATDLPGGKQVMVALTGVKGIGKRMAALVADEAKVPREAKIGALSDEDIERLTAVVGGLNENTPGWMRNRQHDYDTGDDIHNIGNEIEIATKDDINRLKKIRAYRGIRHEAGLPVRGQRTRANNRKGAAVGVQRKKE
jgi:small subunit ribosomal protein S13